MTDDSNEEHFETDDFIYTKKDGVIMGGGYRINSLFLNDSVEQHGGGVSLNGTKFEHLVVPAGLFYIPYTNMPSTEYDEHAATSHITAADDLMDKLLQLASVKKEKHTRKKAHVRMNRRKTKKRR